MLEVEPSAEVTSGAAGAEELIAGREPAAKPRGALGASPGMWQLPTERYSVTKGFFGLCALRVCQHRAPRALGASEVVQRCAQRCK